MKCRMDISAFGAKAEGLYYVCFTAFKNKINK